MIVSQGFNCYVEIHYHSKYCYFSTTEENHNHHFHTNFHKDEVENKCKNP